MAHQAVETGRWRPIFPPHPQTFAIPPISKMVQAKPKLQKLSRRESLPRHKALRISCITTTCTTLRCRSSIILLRSNDDQSLSM